MRILFADLNCHSDGTEIAGIWPPTWVTELAGSLKAAGFDDIHIIGAMTLNVSADDLHRQMATLKPDVVDTTVVSPAIWKAESVQKIAPEANPARRGLFVEAAVRLPPSDAVMLPEIQMIRPHRAN